MLLLDCLHRDPGRLRPAELSGLDDRAWREMVASAYRLGVAELLYERLLARGLTDALPPPIRDELMDRCRRTAAANARLQGELTDVVAALRDGGVEAIWLKGVLLALDIHGHLAWRPAGDIDLLVRPAELERAASILVEAGYRPHRPYTLEAIVASTHHLPPFSMDGRSSVELHWTLLPPGAPYDVPPDELWECAVPTSVGGVDALGLSPEHLLLHQCLHTSYRHLFAGGLHPACDIAGVVERHGDALDWAALVATAHRWRVAPGVGVALRVARDLVGAAVPAGAIGELAAVDPAVVSACRAQMLSPVASSERATMSVELPRLVRGGGTAGRRALLARRLLPPREEVATVYGVDSRSPRVYPYYAVRAKDMIARHWRFVPAYLGLGRDAPAAAFAVRQGQIAGWLAEERIGGPWR